MKRIFITGGTGFIGSHLAEYLAHKGMQVFVTTRHKKGGSTKKYTVVVCDCTNKNNVEQTIQRIRPDTIFHLAAQSSPSLSWEKPQETFEVNVSGTIHLLEAVRRYVPHARMMIICSSAEYAPKYGHIREEDAIRPNSPYGVSKYTEGMLARLYSDAFGIQTVRVRPFAIIGPRKRGDFCSDVARQIVAIERGKQEKVITAGNLRPIRDFLDIRDAVKALTILARHGKRGDVYNLASGRGTALRNILQLFLTMAPIGTKVKSQKRLFRRLDEPSKIGSNRKLKNLGWKPGISLKDSLASILTYWREIP